LIAIDRYFLIEGECLDGPAPARFCMQGVSGSLRVQEALVVLRARPGDRVEVVDVAGKFLAEEPLFDVLLTHAAQVVDQGGPDDRLGDIPLLIDSLVGRFGVELSRLFSEI
jgi:hypothetical protein